MTTVRTYIQVFVALIVLTIATTCIAFVDLGGFFNTAIALAVATVKALLVAVFFMHLRHISRLVWLFAGAGIFWLGILLVLTVSDYMSRGWVSGFELILH
jgi:cytochrome c oxidase subunit IV